MVQTAKQPSMGEGLPKALVEADSDHVRTALRLFVLSVWANSPLNPSADTWSRILKFTRAICACLPDEAPLDIGGFLSWIEAKNEAREKDVCWANLSKAFHLPGAAVETVERWQLEKFRGSGRGEN